MDKEKVLESAKLARIELQDKEAEDLAKEFGSILDYVGEIKQAVKGKKATVLDRKGSHLHNVLREDTKAHEPGLYTEALLEQAPSKEGGYIKVKKIL